MTAGKPRNAGSSHPRLLLPSLLILLCAGCQQPPTLTSTFASPTEVAQAVVAGLTVSDANRLDSIAMTETEFRDVVWPELPASRPERNLPWDYVWQDLRGKSRRQLSGRLRAWDNQGFEVVRVDFAGQTTDYRTFRVHRDSVVTLRDKRGRQASRRLFGSMIEQRGRYKVFSYVVD
jgi:hypothetical protein